MLLKMKESRLERTQERTQFWGENKLFGQFLAAHSNGPENIKVIL